MTTQTRTQRFGWPICIIAAITVTSVGWGIYQSRRFEKEHDKKAPLVAKTQFEVNRPIPQILELSDTMITAMHLKTVAAVTPVFSKMLHFRGSLAIDPNRLSHVHSRFPGQIIELATVSGLRSQQTEPAAFPARLLQNFDFVNEGMKLAIIAGEGFG